VTLREGEGGCGSAPEGLGANTYLSAEKAAGVGKGHCKRGMKRWPQKRAFAFRQTCGVARLLRHNSGPIAISHVLPC
jgi:hypothetical protein